MRKLLLTTLTLLLLTSGTAFAQDIPDVDREILGKFHYGASWVNLVYIPKINRSCLIAFSRQGSSVQAMDCWAGRPDESVVGINPALDPANTDNCVACVTRK